MIEIAYQVSGETRDELMIAAYQVANAFFGDEDGFRFYTLKATPFVLAFGGEIKSWVMEVEAVEYRSDPDISD